MADAHSFWQISAPATVPSDELPRAAEVVVIGGGWLGVCTAYWLARAGLAPLLLEQGAVAHGASGRNGGFMVPGTAESYPDAIARLGHETARAVWALTLDSRALLQAVLAEEEIDCDYREPGHLNLALGEPELAGFAAAAGALEADGFMAQLLNRQQAQELVATPLGPEIAGALYLPEAGLLHSVRLVRGVALAAQRHGARICTQTPVSALHATADGLAFVTPRGELRARALVVTANAWAGQLVPALAALIRPVRGQALAYAEAAPIFRLGMGAALTPTGEYWQQTPGGAVVLGGCRALASGRDEGLLAMETSAEVQAGLERVLPRLFPALAELRVAARWAGPMAFTPDYLPIADAVPGLPSAWIAGGFCGHGMPFGMIFGRLLAEAVTAGKAPSALAPFRLRRPSL